jgi:Kelch motif
MILCRFGGHDERSYHFNDTWSFDISTRKWTELQCTGCVPTPRGMHAAALVNGVMYVFGGSVTSQPNLDDLIALQLSSE